VPLSQGLAFSAGPRFTLESTGATAPYFSITPLQAALSGLPAFNARGGAHSAGVGAQLRYHINPQWEVHSYVEYQRLLGDAAASPLVQLRGSPNQVTVGLLHYAEARRRRCSVISGGQLKRTGTTLEPAPTEV
jgi:outer membrane protein